jgi:hypothetical protein
MPKLFRPLRRPSPKRLPPTLQRRGRPRSSPSTLTSTKAQPHRLLKRTRPPRRCSWPSPSRTRCRRPKARRRRRRPRPRSPTSAASRRSRPVEEELIEGGAARHRARASRRDRAGQSRRDPLAAARSLSGRPYPIPDRWRLIQSLGIVTENYWDPYHQNTLKGDRPLCTPEDESEAARNALGCRVHRFLGLTGSDWFFSLNAISDTVVEPRTFPIPVGVQTTQRPDSNDVFGRPNSTVAVQTFIFGFALTKGSTAYRPPTVEYRFAAALQANYVDVPERRVLDVRPSIGSNRFDYALGIQEAFVDYELGISSERYDFYSVRLGIQPFNFDFRGFLSRTSSSACACSAIATTTASSIISKRSGGSRRTPIPASTTYCRRRGATGSCTPTCSARISRSSA